MDIEKVKEFASIIKHCGDYGELWVSDDTVWWVAGDADFDPDEVEAGYCTDYDEIKKGFKSIEGVKTVEIEAECSPGEADGFTNLGKFGIDNWNEVNGSVIAKLAFMFPKV